jgi:hypothetical protein
MSTSQSEVKKLLASKQVADLPSTPKGEVIIVTSKETPYDAFKVNNRAILHVIRICYCAVKRVNLHSPSFLPYFLQI